MRITSLLLLAGICLQATHAKEPFKAESLENDWSAVLSEHVDESGRVDYARIRSDPKNLEAVYNQITHYSPDSHPHFFPSEEHRFAYWLNAYNIATMKAVIDNYPIKSVQDVSGFSFYALFDGGVFFAGIKHRFGGKRWSLYKLEHKLIRKRYEDPRLHFALNCASIGCPELPQAAFQADTLEQQLDFETRAFMNDERKFRIDDQKEEIQVSSLFDWYKEDFLKPKSEATSVIEFIKPYLNANNRAALDTAVDKDYSIAFIEYDWGLNDQALK